MPQQLPPLKPAPKHGTEPVTNNGAPTGYILHDFWRWSVSDILRNATRRRFAEFLVGDSWGGTAPTSHS